LVTDLLHLTNIRVDTIKTNYKMKIISYLFLCLSLLSCKNASKPVVVAIDSLSDSNLNYQTIKQVVDAISQNAPQTCNYACLREQIQRYSKTGIAAVAISESLIRKHIAALNDAEKDSIYVLFTNMYYEASRVLSDCIDSKYTDLTQKIEQKIHDSQVTNFEQCLDICGMCLSSTEGAYYAGEKPDYLFSLFSGRGSAALDEYLKLTNKELKEGYVDDAALLISFDNLYKRVLAWEDFINNYPKSFLITEAQGYYNSYLGTLLSGLDNSRVFDSETNKLIPELQALYEQIVSKNDSRKSSKTIAEFYALVKSNNFSMPATLNQFLDERGLSSMLGVQPETR